MQQYSHADGDCRGSQDSANAPDQAGIVTPERQEAPSGDEEVQVAVAAKEEQPVQRPHTFSSFSEQSSTAPTTSSTFSASPGRVYTAPAAPGTAVRANKGEEGASSRQVIPTAPQDDGHRRRNLSRRSQNTEIAATKRRVEEVVDALENTPWHVVYPTDSWSLRTVVVVNSTVQPFPRPLDVPRSAQAVIVIILLKHQRAGHEYVVELQKRMTDAPPVLVLLVPEEGGGDAEEILEVQQLFRMCGVRDSMIQRSTGIDLRLDVAMCVRRAVDAVDYVQSEIQAKLEDHDSLKFWPCAHRVFRGFPKYDPVCTVKPQLGARIKQNDFLEKIGRGGCSEVYLSMNNQSNEHEACKVVPKSNLTELVDVCRLSNEIMYIKSLKHPNIIEFKRVQHGHHHIIIVLEYAGRRNMYRFLKSLPEPNVAIAQNCMKQITAGVAYCHQAGVAHRDLKPENIVLMESEADVAGTIRLKIVDFGCATKASKPCRHISGTMPFIAPEVILAENYNPAKADIWSCGVLFLEMLCGIDCMARMLHWTNPPAISPAVGRQIVTFSNDRRSIHHSLKTNVGIVDEDLLALLFGLLEVSLQQRWTASDMVNCTWLTIIIGDDPLGT